MDQRTNRSEIPLVDLKRQYHSIAGDVNGKVHDVMESGWFVLGNNVDAFEKEFAAYCGVRHAVGVGSGTAALALALKALGIMRDDEVLTVPNTFIATAYAISYAAAKPSFVDIDAATHNMRTSEIERSITKKTRALLPVHLYGYPAEMPSILELAKRRDLPIVEDACQSHGSEYEGRKVGSFGDCACFSFFPSKNLGCYGDGGMVVTNSPEIAEKLRLLRNCGEKQKYHHSIVGYNSRLDEIQAAVLRVKLRHLDEWNEKRRRHARLYNDLLSGVLGISTPSEGSNAKHVYHLYVIRTRFRDELRSWLKRSSIVTGIHYPIPIHLQEPYKHLALNIGEFPVAERMANEIISLPMFPELTEDEIIYVCESIKEFAKSHV